MYKLWLYCTGTSHTPILYRRRRTTLLTATDQQTYAEIDQQLAKLDKLHSSPLVALRVMEIMRQEDYEMIDLA